MYLPMLGPAIVLAWLLSRYERRWLAVAAGMTLTIFALVSFVNAGHWKNELTLAEHSVAVNQNSFAAHTLLGDALARRRRDQDAAVHFRRSIEVNPDYAPAYEGYSQLLVRSGRLDEATATVRRYIKAVSSYPEYARPDIAGAYTDLGLALLARGKYEEALGEFQQALKIDPTRAKAKAGMQEARQKMMTSRSAAGR
jgi:tetratricopeptide (TPR) repeat protein